jgi:hypothetical protein
LLVACFVGLFTASPWLFILCAVALLLLHPLSFLLAMLALGGGMVLVVNHWRETRHTRLRDRRSGQRAIQGTMGADQDE